MKIAILGGVNQITVHLVPLLLSSGHDLTVLSRVPRPQSIAAHPRLDWAGDPENCRALIGIAPAVVVASQIARSHRLEQVVQFSSMSALTKRNAASGADRRLAAQLLQGEQVVAAKAQARGVRCIIVRPTLIYGHGMDQNLTRVAHFIQRWGRFPLCGKALGLRNPVHAADLSELAAAAAQSDGEGVFAAGGGETLPYREMIARVFRSLSQEPRFLQVAGVVPGLCQRLARLPGLARLGTTGAILQRMNQDMAADNDDVSNAFGWQPRTFRPTSATWTPLATRE